MEEKKRALIVDDEPLIVELISTCLNDEGFQASGAATTDEAMAAMQKAPANIVLLDLNLPGMNGMDFLKQFKQTYSQVPVVILTGAGYDQEKMKKAESLGASGYISKETELAEILKTIQQFVK